MGKPVLTALFLLATKLLLAQFTVRGNVQDEAEPMIYASVYIKEKSTIGTSTDLDGDFELKIPEELGEKCTVVVSYIGYVEQEYEVTAKNNTLNLMLEKEPDGWLVTIVHNYDFIPHSNQVTISKLVKNNDLSIVPILSEAPGIHMYSGALNTNRIVIRGIGSRSPYATSRLKAYLDNIPLSSGDGETTLEDIDLSLIKSLNISKGPTKSSYGANLGGRILLNTYNRYGDRPKFQFKNSSTVGSYGLFRNTSSFQHNNSERKLQLTANVNVTHNNGYRENSRYDRQGASLLTRKNWKKNETTFLANFVNLKAFIPSSLNQEDYQNEPQKAAFTWAAAKGNEDYHKLLVGLANTVNILDRRKWELSNSSSIFTSYRDNYETRPFNILDENSLAMGLRTSFDLYQSRREVKISLGGEIFKEDYAWKTLDTETASNLLSDNEEDRVYFNGFLQTAYQPFGNFFLEAGLNLNRTSYKYQDLLSVSGADLSAQRKFKWLPSPRLDIRYEVENKIKVYGTASHGFSAPSLEETLRPDGGINPDIQVEKGWNFEIGASGRIKKFYYQASAYTMHVKDLLVARRIGQDQYIGVNAGKTQHNGLEFSAYCYITNNNNPYRIAEEKYKLKPYLNYTLSAYTFKEFINDGEDYSGNSLTGVAPHQLNLGLDLSTALGIYGNVSYNYHSAYPLRDDNSIDSEAYHLTNIKVGYAKKIKERIKIDLSFGINNLFNEKYASMHVINANGFGGAAPRYYYPGLPRNFYGNFTVGYEL